MRRKLTVAALACAALALAPAGAHAATAATCTSSRPTLKWEVVGEGRRRAVSLGAAGFSSAAAVKPIAVTVMRSGGSGDITFHTSQSEYVYRPKRGERVRFLAVYIENSGNYGGTNFGARQPITISLPIVGLLPGIFSNLFPGNQVTALLPVPTFAGTFAAGTCARALPLTVSEASSARKAGARRGFRARRSF